MKAVRIVKDGGRGWEVCEMERPEPKPNEVEIQVKSAAICGSDFHYYLGMMTGLPIPVTIGHEYAGVISRVGSNVKDWKVGDRVISENHTTACGSCDACRSGLPVMCKVRKITGMEIDGGWCDYKCMPANLLIKIPDNLSYDEASLTEPCSITTMAICVKNPIKPGEKVLVTGCGTIGLFAAMVAKASGAGKVFITGLDVDEPVRLKVARQIPGIEVVNIQKQDLNQIIMDETDGVGIDYVVECSGAPAAIDQAIDLLKKNGRLVGIGIINKETIPFRYDACINKNLNIGFSWGNTYEAWKLALQFMSSGLMDVKPLITHTYPLVDFKKGMDVLEANEAIKVVLHPGE